MSSQGYWHFIIVQLLLAHSESNVHVSMAALRQTPLPSQASVPLQTGLLLVSGLPAPILVQVPLLERLHAWQTGQVAVPQQAPSTQFPVAQSVFAEQDCPLLLPH